MSEIDPSVSSFAAEQLEDVEQAPVEAPEPVEVVPEPIAPAEIPLSALRVSPEGVILSKVDVSAEGVVLKVLEA